MSFLKYLKHESLSKSSIKSSKSKIVKNLESSLLKFGTKNPSFSVNEIWKDFVGGASAEISIKKTLGKFIEHYGFNAKVGKFVKGEPTEDGKGDNFSATIYWMIGVDKNPKSVECLNNNKPAKMSKFKEFVRSTDGPNSNLRLGGSKEGVKTPAWMIECSETIDVVLAR
jgi:hypothetical protein